MTRRKNVEPSRSPRSLSRRWRCVISVLLLFHLVAVFLPPFSFQSTSPISPSPFADPLMRLMRPYIDLLYLNHGYAFFAPDPGPSHLIRAELEFDDGRPPLELTFPDLQEQWPRLLYHRHFMLSEQLNSQFVPPEPPPGINGEAEPTEGWKQGREMYELKWMSFADHLRAKYDAANVTLTRVRHRMIDVDEVQERGRRLNDPETFIDLDEAIDLPEDIPPGELP